MLFQNDPFRDVDALFNRLGSRTWSGQPMAMAMAMAMDAYRRGEEVWVHVDVPGISPDSLEINVERNVLTLSAERDWPSENEDRTYLSERPRGAFRRQVHLGEGLDADAIEADLSDGVLTLRIPVAEKAKPRKINVGIGRAAAIEAESTSA